MHVFFWIAAWHVSLSINCYVTSSQAWADCQIGVYVHAGFCSLVEHLSTGVIVDSSVWVACFLLMLTHQTVHVICGGIEIAHVLHFLASVGQHLSSDDCLWVGLQLCPTVCTLVRAVLTSEYRPFDLGLGFCVCYLVFLSVFLVFFHCLFWVWWSLPEQLIACTDSSCQVGHYVLHTHSHR